MSPNPNYDKGRRLEYRVRDMLEDRGFFVVRSAGSHSPVDLIGLPPSAHGFGAWLIQCKSGRRPSLNSLRSLWELRYSYVARTFIALPGPKMFEVWETRFGEYDYLEKE